MNANSKLPRKMPVITNKSILSAVSSVWGIDAKILLGRSRKQPVAFARQLCMALYYELTGMSLNDVGELFDGRDHGTVIWAIRVVRQAEATDKEIARLITQVRAKITTHP